VIGLNRLVRRYVREEQAPVELDAATRQRLVGRLRHSGSTPSTGQPKI
jgi:hypothetical protein